MSYIGVTHGLIKQLGIQIAQNKMVVYYIKAK